jgi:hypothetical protein
MTIDQFINFLIMPVGGLLLGAVVLYATRNERQPKRKIHPGE